MLTLKYAALAAVAASFTIAAPVLADEMKPGMMVMATADGKVMTMPMPSPNYARSWLICFGRRDVLAFRV